MQRGSSSSAPRATIRRAHRVSASRPGVVPPCLCGLLAALVLYSAAVPALARRARCLDRPRWGERVGIPACPPCLPPWSCGRSKSFPLALTQYLVRPVNDPNRTSFRLALLRQRQVRGELNGFVTRAAA